MRYEPTLEFVKAQEDDFTLGKVIRKRLVKENGK